MFAVFDGKFGSGLQSYRGDVGFKLAWGGRRGGPRFT
jgi:hypothetical protein